ncbi:unnamed protein product [Lactuca virosa]|uniref:Uncharacterized protein n=1 Tax=Lactuca virosa TaxID=75947 RepID=A0AAU9M1A6_9ASTR|nr:unnamed protein product [Lactuca virosa]
MHVNFKYENQVNIVLALMTIHNYIRMSGGGGDETFQRAQEESYILRRDVEIEGGNEAHEEGSSAQRIHVEKEGFYSVGISKYATPPALPEQPSKPNIVIKKSSQTVNLSSLELIHRP